MWQDEQALWPVVGETESRLLTHVRSRRNRRELYRRWLEEALLVQALFTPPADIENQIEADLRRAILAWAEADPPRLPFGIPLPLMVPYGTGHLDLIALDLRGQAPARALAALNRSGEELAATRSVLGLLIIHGQAGQTDLLQPTIQRWVREYGRGALLHAAEAEHGGMLLAIDTRRLHRLREQHRPFLPLQPEVEALTQLLRLTGARIIPHTPHYNGALHNGSNGQAKKNVRRRPRRNGKPRSNGQR